MKNKSLPQKSGPAGFASPLLKGLVWLAIGGAALLAFTYKNNSTMQLKVSVYDTYVPKKQGGVMHFDILVDSGEKDLEKIYGYGRDYLRSKGQEGQPLTSKQCRFCHVENAKGPIEDSIKAKGYYIIEMEGCN
ncbi:MAG TPA: DUF2024 family protein [Saprospiraceae bacterium]|nr:DUF2024 family protein [Saprospiraceae bacterium]